MIADRSVPTATLTPALAYDDVARASDRLCRTFGFAERMRIAEHRGYAWTFSQASDVDPATSGGTLR